MFELLIKLCIGALAVSSGEGGVFRSEEAREMAAARARIMPATEALVQILPNPSENSAWPPAISNGILLKEGWVLTHNHANWTKGDWVISPHRGFHNLTARIELKPDIYLSWIVHEEYVPYDSISTVTDIQCYDPGQMLKKQKMPQMDGTTFPWLSNPKAYRHYVIGDTRPDICLLKLDKPFVGLHFPEVGSADFADEPGILTVLGGHTDSTLYNGSSNDRDLIWNAIQKDYMQARKAWNGYNFTYEIHYPMRLFAFTQPIYDHGHLLASQARLSPSIGGLSVGERMHLFTPTEEELEGILQGGLSGAPIFLNDRVVGVAYGAQIPAFVEAAEARAASDPRFKQYSAANTYYPLYNVYTHLTQPVQDWMRFVMDAGNPTRTVSADVSPAGRTIMPDDRDNDGHPWGPI